MQRGVDFCLESQDGVGKDHWVDRQKEDSIRSKIASLDGTAFVEPLSPAMKSPSRRNAAILLLLFATIACARSEQSKQSARATSTAARPRALRPHFNEAPITVSNVQPYLQEQISDAKLQHERVLVYVGASWCEPCQRFHHAVEQGELDELLPNTRFVEFDADVHTRALNEAGYSFSMIPLIAMPGPDGRASGRQLSGSIKGPDAVRRDLVPRLRALFDGRDVE